VDQPITKTIRALWGHLPARRHLQFKLLVVLTFLSAAFEVVSLGSVIPFIAVITQPDKVMEYSVVSYLAGYLGITTGAELVLPLGIAFGVAAVLSGAVRLSLVWSTIKIGNGCGADLSVDIYRRTLLQPYATHISRSSSEIVSSVTQKVAAVTAVLTSVMVFFTSVFLFLAIVITLIIVDPFIAIACATSFGLAYLAIGLFAKKRLGVNSEIIAREQDQVVKSLQEGLGSIRDVLLDGSQQIYVNLYRESVDNLKRGHCQNAFLNQFPRYAMESLGLVLIAVFVISLSGAEGGVSDSLTVLAALALGAQRLLPIAQQIYGNWSVLAGNQAALLDVFALLEQPLPRNMLKDSSKPLNFNKAISFDDVGFRYSLNDPLVLKHVCLEVPKGARVGIVGGTGGGKSTLLDLLMGLLTPTNGFIAVDGVRLDSSIYQSSWQSLIAHVPQNIFLADCSVGENIAFGVPRDNIDHERVREAARRADIANHIESGPSGYDATVGERGVRLSGGQRQRLGIARALYKNAKVIIFDEATSALDSQTERRVMRTIEELSREITIFIVAHRISTLKNCDFIIKLQDGEIAGKYDYNEMMQAESN
jgi:ABC-type multidrug transport system fused ATPase/permease subunit